MHEWSLIGFTLLTQLAVGAFIATSLFFRLYSLPSGEGFYWPSIVKTLMAITVMAIAALIVSFLHLGTPSNAFHALNNIVTSWLSREILFVAMFAGGTAVVTLLYFKTAGSPKLIRYLVILTALAGILAILAMAKVYMLETVPAWNSLATPMQFFLTTLILGAAFVLMTGTFTGRKTLITTLKILLVFILLSIILWPVHVYLLSGEGIAAEKSLGLIMSGNSLLFYVRMVLPALAVLMILYALFKKDTPLPSGYFVALFILLAATEIMGRYLFYASYVRIGV